MRVAIPLFHSRISPHFSYARDLLVATKGESGDWKTEKVCCWPLSPLQKANLLFERETTTLICGGIHRNLLHYLERQGIRVVAGVMGEAEEALRLFAEGQLGAGMTLPGCCRLHRQRWGPPWSRREGKE